MDNADVLRELATMKADILAAVDERISIAVAAYNNGTDTIADVRISELNVRMDDLRDTGVSVASFRLSIAGLAAQTAQMVDDVNSNLRGFESRVRVLELNTGSDASKTLQNLARALGNMSEHLEC